MRFPINARTAMLLMPIMLLTALEYLLKIPFVSGNPLMGNLIHAVINYGLPLLFAVLAVLTVPNSEQKYRPIATIGVYGVILSTAGLLCGNFPLMAPASGFSSALIVGSIPSSSFRSPADGERRPVLLGGAVLVAVVLTTAAAAGIIFAEIHNLLTEFSSSVHFSTKPGLSALFFTGTISGLFDPFGIQALVINVAASMNISASLLRTVDPNITTFCLPCLVLAIFMRMKGKKRTTAFILFVITGFNAVFPSNATTYIFEFIAWMWPLIYLMHIVLSGILLIAISLTVDMLSNAENGEFVMAMVILSAGLLYYLSTLGIIRFSGSDRLTWHMHRIPEQVKVFADRSSSHDLSLTAVSIFKAFGGMSNIRGISSSGDRLIIACRSQDSVNGDAIVRITGSAPVLCNNSDEIALSLGSSAGETAQKMLMFARRLHYL